VAGKTSNAKEKHEINEVFLRKKDRVLYCKL
jgi:hypothetical protein